MDGLVLVFQSVIIITTSCSPCVHKRKKKNENTTEVSTVNDYNSILKIVKGTTLFQSMIHNLAD